MRREPRKWRRLLIVGAVLLVAGYIVDQVWVAGHPDLASTAEQVKGHLVFWAATVVIAVASVGAIRSGHSNPGHVVALLGSVALGVADATHSWEHIDGGGTAVIHDVLSVALAVLVVGLVLALIWDRVRRTQVRRPSLR